MEATVTIAGAREADDAAKRARRHLDLGQDMVLRDLADLFREGEADVFDSHGQAIGAAWPPLKDSTQKARARLARRFGLPISPSRPMLFQFGDLRAALSVKGGAHEQFVGKQEVRLAVNTGRINRHDRKRGLGLTLTKSGNRRKPRGKGARYPENIIDIHEKGLGDVPRRQVLGTPNDVERKMEARVERYLDSIAAAMESSGQTAAGSGE